MKVLKSKYTYILVIILLTITNIVNSDDKVVGQIIPDQTLGTKVNTSNPAKTIIENGTAKGINLFHSFEKFNIGENENVYFQNPNGVENILTRVTGSNASQVLGKLGVEGTANLYLINPHGIYFGDNASLDIAGSFIATTADSITLGENGLFSATAPDTSNLLNIAPNALFINALTNQQARIENHGNLQVGDTSNIRLFAVNIHSFGKLIAPGGNIELTATGNIIVRGNIDTSSKDYHGGNIQIYTTQGNIDIKNSGLNSNAILPDMIDGINSYNNGGSIEINASQGRINIENTSLHSNTFTPNGQAGDIAIRSEAIGDILAIQLIDTFINTAAYGSYGQSGAVIISAMNNGEIRFLGKTQQPEISADTFAIDPDAKNRNTGGAIYINGGNININNYAVQNIVHQNSYGNGNSILINGENVNVENNSIIKTLVEIGSVAISGNIFINANNAVKFQDSQIITSNLGQNIAGDVEISGNNLVSLVNTKINSSSKRNIDSSSYSYIKINSETGLINLNEVTMETNNWGRSYAGAIELNAGDTININNLTNLNSQGNYGYILMNSQNLKIDNSSLKTNNPSSDSDAGFMRFIMSKTAEINHSKLVSKGNLGYIYVESPLLTINNTEISTNSPLVNKNAGNIEVYSSEKIAINDSHLKSQGQEGNILLVSPYVVLDNSIVNTTNSNIFYAVNQLVNSGNISISATNEISILHNSQLIAFTERRGNAGNITLNASTGSITINDGSLLSSSVETNGIGNGGYIYMNTQKLQLLEGIQIKTYVEPGGIGNAGNIKLENLRTLEMNNSKISATSIDGQAGSININAQEFIAMKDNDQISVESIGIGSAGSLNIHTSELLITDGAKISASNNNGSGGNININADYFTASNGGKLISNTSGKATAGSIVLNVKKNINLDGANTGIFASTNPGSSGDSGNINIDPEVVIIQNGAGVAVNSYGTGKGGNIYLQADILTLDKNAFIAAETASNQGGDIYLTISDLLFLRHGSNISASAGKVGAGGNGGNINIDAPFILGVTGENSDITANAFSGNGGNITINSQSILGLEFREQQTFSSDITASSQFGLSGNVNINSLNVNPAQGLVVLPSNFLDASRQLTPRCSRIARQKNRFTIVGKGGLSSHPDDLFTGISPIVNVVDVVSYPDITKAITKPVVIKGHVQNIQNHQDRVIQQAKGWIIGDDGQVVLTVSSPQPTSGYMGIKDVICEKW